MLDAIHAAVGTFGNVFVVVNSSDTDEGNYQHLQELFSPDSDGRVRIFTSLSDAYSATESNNNDVIVLDGNSTHTLTAMLTVANNRVHFIGMDYLLGIRRRYGQSSKINIGVTTAVTDIATMKNTGVRNSFRGLKITSDNTLTQALYVFADGGEYTYMENCELYRSTKYDVTGAAELACNGDSSMYKDCYIGTTVTAISGAIIRPCVTFTRELAATGAVARDVTFEGCIFARKFGHTANRFMYGLEANAVERLVLIKDCIFWGAKLSTAIPAQNIAFGSSLTDGNVLLVGSTSINAGTAMSTTTGVFTADGTPDATGAAAGISIQCA